MSAQECHGQLSGSWFIDILVAGECAQCNHLPWKGQAAQALLRPAVLLWFPKFICYKVCVSIWSLQSWSLFCECLLRKMRALSTCWERQQRAADLLDMTFCFVPSDNLLSCNGSWPGLTIGCLGWKGLIRLFGSTNNCKAKGMREEVWSCISNVAIAEFVNNGLEIEEWFRYLQRSSGSSSFCSYL